jgi:tripartite-type tricarboxylate transporter receptor subunit TctC
MYNTGTVALPSVLRVAQAALHGIHRILDRCAFHGNPGGSMKRTFVIAALVASAAFLHGKAMAQAGAASWPARPIRMVVPFGAGSPPDVVARVISRSLSEGGLGQQVVVENRVGAGGTIGSEAVAKAPADGYTIMLGSTSTLAIAPSLYPNLTYKPERDFGPIILAASAPFFIVVHPSLGVNSVEELIELAKAKPGQLSYGSTGNGTPLHIAGEMFKTTTGVNIVHVPYKETGPVNNDFLAGRLQIMFQQLPSLVQHILAGRLKPIAVASARRDRQLPDVPTTSEAGLAGYNVSSWFGVVAPRGSPPEAIERLNIDMNKVLSQSGVRDTLTRLGFEPSGGSPGEFAAFISSENTKWSNAVKSSGARLD